MLHEALRAELVAMRDEDLRVRQELVDAGELGGSYVPRMEAVHVRNAQRLEEIIIRLGWPDEQMAGEDGAKAAWLIAQHSVGSPGLQKLCLRLLQNSADQGRVPRWHCAYLEDRIAMQEGRPQRFGTQWMDDPVDGRARPWAVAEVERVNEWRAGVGLPPMPPIAERGPELPAEQQLALQANQAWWEDWFVSQGWRENATPSQAGDLKS
jgi:hypothetical protein